MIKTLGKHIMKIIAVFGVLLMGFGLAGAAQILAYGFFLWDSCW